jgi:tetratricopeptide (TPR) repeat protein
MGVRRGRPGLKRAALLLFALAGCAGLNEEEEARLDVYRANANDYFDRADYQRSLDQSSKALELVPDDVNMMLLRAHSLLRLGAAFENPNLLNDSLAAFEEMRAAVPDDDRAWLGLGSAHLARVLALDHEVARCEQRLESEFLSQDGRRAEEARVAEAVEARAVHLTEAEVALREVLGRPLQKDNPIALTDLVLVLHAQGGRDAEALPLADRAVKLLDESSDLAQTTLDTNKRLPPAARLELEKRLRTNREKELNLRDLLATAALQRGDTDGFLLQMQLLDDRGLLDEVQYWNRAGVYERMGRLDLAVADLENFLRLRSRRFPSYDEDNMAPEVYKRIEGLRERQAAAPPR